MLEVLQAPVWVGEEEQGVSRAEGQGKQPCFPGLVLLLAWLRMRYDRSESLRKSAKVQLPAVTHLV